MRKFALGLLSVVLLSGLVASKRWMDDRQRDRRTEADIRYLPSPQMTELLSLGYRPAVADVFWIEGLNYFGSELLRKSRTYKYMDSYLSVILKLDPLWSSFYEWAATSFIYNGLPITRQGVVKSIDYVNRGIQNLNSVGRSSSDLFSKGAFNYALEAHDHENSIPYFRASGRSSPAHRNQLLVGSTYSQLANNFKEATELKMQYLGYMVLEAQNRQQFREAVHILTSPKFNQEAINIARTIRLQLERDEELRELVDKRFRESLVLGKTGLESPGLPSDPRLQKVFKVNIKKNWLPPDLHLLLMF